MGTAISSSVAPPPHARKREGAVIDFARPIWLQGRMTTILTLLKVDIVCRPSGQVRRTAPTFPIGAAA